MSTTGQHEVYAKIFKVLADANRLKIVEILSCGERCACEIQAFFEITQPTLSHHMKILMQSGLVTSRKEGQWTYYALINQQTEALIDYFSNLLTDTEACLCKEIPDHSRCIDKRQNEKGCSL